MIKHTPTPYHVHHELDGLPENNVNYDRLFIQDQYGSDVACLGDAKDGNLPNAAFIVRACNLHDELVFQLEAMINLAVRAYGEDPKTLAACETLAKARGTVTQTNPEYESYIDKQQAANKPFLAFHAWQLSQS